MSGFTIQANKNGIPNPISSKPPINLENICKQVAGSRKTALPPELAYKRYARTVATAPNKAAIVIKVSGRLLKELDNKGYKKYLTRHLLAF